MDYDLTGMSTQASDSAAVGHRGADSLASAMLTSAGGGLDAFVYLNHGHVFAAAMTETVCCWGVAVLRWDWMQAMRHLLPIFGFVAGVLAPRCWTGS